MLRATHAVTCHNPGIGTSSVSMIGKMLSTSAVLNLLVALDVPVEIAEAEGIEHHVSDATLKAFAILYKGHPLVARPEKSETLECGHLDQAVTEVAKSMHPQGLKVFRNQLEFPNRGLPL